MDSDILNRIPGGRDLLDWFGGRVHSFHDSEIVTLALNREGARATLSVHTFEMTPEVDSRGYYVCVRHAVVTFQMRWVEELELDGYNPQNALMGLSISETEAGLFKLDLDPASGLGGCLAARELEISLEPGIPSDSIYQSSEHERP